MTVFDDPLAQTFPDDLHSLAEERLITIGLSKRNRLLFIAHQERDNSIRIIGARTVTSSEREAYEELNGIQ